MAVGDVTAGANLGAIYTFQGPGTSTGFVLDSSAVTSGYTTTLAMDDTGLSIRHNSASRDIRLGVNSGSNLNIDTAGDVGIGTAAPVASANPEISSTTKALLVSRMTTTQRDALTPVNGMVIYNSTTATLQGYQGGAWSNL